MIHFRQITLTQIKFASSEKEVEVIVHDSIQRLKVKNINGHIIQRFIQSMMMTLSQERVEKSSTRCTQNIDYAIGLFKNLHKA